MVIISWIMMVMNILKMMMNLLMLMMKTLTTSAPQVRRGLATAQFGSESPALASQKSISMSCYHQQHHSNTSIKKPYRSSSISSSADHNHHNLHQEIIIQALSPDGCPHPAATRKTSCCQNFTIGSVAALYVMIRCYKRLHYGIMVL